MVSRTEIFLYVKVKYGVEPDYPWARTPNCAILRHKDNRKWFAAVLDITENKLGLNSKNLVDTILLKCDPLLIGSLRGEEGIFPGYHMNKEHWITIHLGTKIPKEKVYSLIDLSFELTLGRLTTSLR